MKNKNFLFAIILSVIALIGLSFKVHAMDFNMLEEFQKTRKEEYKAEEKARKIREPQIESYSDKVERYTHKILANFSDHPSFWGSMVSFSPSRSVAIGLAKLFYLLDDVGAVIEAYDKAIDKYYVSAPIGGPAPTIWETELMMKNQSLRNHFYIKGKPELERYVYEHAQ